MSYHLLEFETPPGETRVRLTININANTGGTVKISCPFDREAANGIRKFANEIHPESARTKEYPDLGNQLSKTLFGDDATSIAKLKLEGTLWIISNQPEILEIPFELFFHDLSIRRASHLLAVNRPQSPARSGPLRILFVSCSPDDEDRLAFEQEEEAMIEICSQAGESVYLEIAESGTFEAIQNRINKFRPHIVHLSGHSYVDNGIGFFCFENQNGNSHNMEASEIAAKLRSADSVLMAFVSGCETASGVAGVCQSLVDGEKIPLVIGWSRPVADATAIAYGTALYKQLSTDCTVDEAMHFARHETLNDDFFPPRLYASSSTEKILDFSMPQESPRRRETMFALLDDGIPGMPSGFVGRRRLIQRTLPILRDALEGKTILLLTGIGGSGKSTLATRLANRLDTAGLNTLSLKLRPGEDHAAFADRILDKILVAARRVPVPPFGCGTVVDQQAPIGVRMQSAIEVLKDLHVVMVIDNLDELMNPTDREFPNPSIKSFFTALVNGLSRGSRAILTCRSIPAGMDPIVTNFIFHEPMTDFTEADFIKYAEYDERVSARVASGELSRHLLIDFHRKFGATPRFVRQAVGVLANWTPYQIRKSLNRRNRSIVAAGTGQADDKLRTLQQDFFTDIFLSQLYLGLSLVHRKALSCLAVSEMALPIGGVAAAAGLDISIIEQAIGAWLDFGLVQRFSERDARPTLYSIYPLQRSFLTEASHLGEAEEKAANTRIAAWLQELIESNPRVDVGRDFMALHYFCLIHAHAATDARLKVWAADRINTLLIGSSKFQIARHLTKKLVESDRQPDLLKLHAEALQLQGELETARQLLLEAVSKYEAESEDSAEKDQQAHVRKSEAESWHQIAVIEVNQGEYGNARVHFDNALALWQLLKEPGREADAFFQKARVDVIQGNHGSAITGLAECRRIRNSIGDHAGEAAALYNLGVAMVALGRFREAATNFRESLMIKQILGDKAEEAAELHSLANLSAESCGLSIASFQLAALSRNILQATQHSDVLATQETMDRISARLDFTPKGLQEEILVATESYHQDHGDALLSSAFPEPT